MRYLLSCLLIAGLLATAPSKSQAAGAVSVDVFYNALEPQGEWLDVGDYGYCWRPNGVDESWRPYADGHWVSTDLGWTWVSDEPWGWATYHYGRWANVSDVGWVWVPGTEWAPAWVSWRHSDRYVGWAPLPPEARFEARIGIKSWADGYYDIGPANYSFVETRRFGSPSLRTVIVEPQQNITIINQTTNITNITYNNNVVVVGGPQYEEVSRVSEQPIQRLRIERRTDIAVDAESIRSQKFTSQVSGDRLQIVAPSISATAQSTYQPKNVRKIEASKVERGWAKSGDPAAVQQMRAKMKAEAKVPAGLPPQPKFEKISAATSSVGAASQTDASATAGASPAATVAATAMPSATAAVSPAAREMASPAASPLGGLRGKGARKAAVGASPAAEAGASPMMTPRGKNARREQINSAPGADVSPSGAASPAMSPAMREKRKMQQPRMAAPSPSTSTDAAPATPDATPHKGPKGEGMAAPAGQRPRRMTPESTPVVRETTAPDAAAAPSADRPNRPKHGPATAGEAGQRPREAGPGTNPDHAGKARTSEPSEGQAREGQPGPAKKKQHAPEGSATPVEP